MSAAIIDLAATRHAARRQPTTLADLYDSEDSHLRLQIARVLIGLDLDPVDYFDTELGEVMDAILQAAHELRERLAATQGLVVV